MPFEFSVPTPTGGVPMSVEAGSSVIFVGANGGGKTRLAAKIEADLGLTAHRISAHRALRLNPSVAKISEALAISGLRTGNASPTAHQGHRIGSRWSNKAEVGLLEDFDYLIQALFADQGNVSLASHNRLRKGEEGPPQATKFETLEKIWRRLLPHRQLHFTGDNISVSLPNSATTYAAESMSDGERGIFYLIGQVLAAAQGTLLIIDEPELHIHRSVTAKLWDELEAVRPDCAFVFITHDLEFAAYRVATKFVIRDFDPTPRWTIETVPDDTGFNEEVATLILGSRRPILFVEGTETSLDLAIYRCCYPDWTVIARGSSEEVIHAVATMRANANLTRVTCSGIVDADDYQPGDIDALKRLGVEPLSVSEIENIFLLPAVSRAIAEGEGFKDRELEKVLEDLKTAVFAAVNSDAAIDAVAARYCRRRIDRALKAIDLSDAKGVIEIAAEYARQTAALNVANIANEAKTRITKAIRDGDWGLLLANYDNKAMLDLAAKHLRRTNVKAFQEWLLRVLRNSAAPGVVTAIQAALPIITPS